MGTPRGLKSAGTSVVPTGLGLFFRFYPALKRWAKIYRPSGAGSWSNSVISSHWNFGNRVLTHGLKSLRNTKNKSILQHGSSFRRNDYTNS